MEENQGSSATEPPLPLPRHPNIFIKPVHPAWDEESLRRAFQSFGEILSVKIESSTQEFGSAHAFVRFRTIQAAGAALRGLDQGIMLEGELIRGKLADSDIRPKLETGLMPSQWCYCRGLPADMAPGEAIALFSLHGTVQDYKYFPSTEHYRRSGALVQFETIEQAHAVIEAMNGIVLPGDTHPMLVRFADSPAEKAAKAARKESRNWKDHDPGAMQMQEEALRNLEEQLQMQLILQSLGQANASIQVPETLTSMTDINTFVSSSTDTSPSVLAVPFNIQHVPALPGNVSTNFNTLQNLPMTIPSISGRSSAAGGTSLYIKGLPEAADKLWLYENFARFGGIYSVRVLIDDKTGKCNGIGFVNFTSPEAAKAAHEIMNGVNMGERLLHVMIQNQPGGLRAGQRTGNRGVRKQY